MPYIGTSPSNSVRRVHTYTATASQTTFSGASSEGVTLSYVDANYLDVFQNGVLLGSDDYTATSGTSVVLSQSASLSDLVVIIVYDVFSVADTVSKTNGGSFDSAVTMSNNLTVSGAFTSQGIDDNADATAITIDSSEKVGIGTTSPSTPLDVGGHIRVTGGNDCDIEFQSGSNRRKFIGGDSNNLELGTYSSSNTSRDIHAQILSNGNVLIGTTNELAGINNTGVGISLRGASTANSIIASRDDGTAGYFNRNSNGTLIAFRRSGTEEGSISVTTTATSFNTSSDYRLKQSVTYDFDATTRLKKLKPCRFNFIADADTTVDGFLAHEVSSIVPGAVTGKKDATNEDGSIKPQGIDQSKLVPLLVKTIQELEARITALENAE